MSKKSNEEILDRIKKLRALASSNNVHEAAAAAAMVQKLVEKYSLQDALLQMDQKPADRTEAKIEEQVLYEFGGPRVQTYTLDLVCAVGRNNGVKVYYTSGRGTVPGRIKGAGTATDLEVTKALVMWLEAEVERLYKECRPKGEARGDMTKGEAKSWGFSFRNGAVKTIGDRLYQARLEARRLLEAKAKVEDALSIAVGKQDSETLLLLDGMIHKVNKDEALTDAELSVVEKLLPASPQRYAVARITDAIAVVAEKQQKAHDWANKVIGLKSGPRRPVVGKSDAVRGSRPQGDAFNEGKKAGHRARLQPKKEV